MTKVAIIIVNWNTGALLTQCVQSILQLPEQELIHSIIIVDNASHDDSIAQLQRALPNPDKRLILITSPRNLGFAKANNMAAASIVTAEVPHIFLLNPDTVVQPYALRTLINVLEQFDRCGVAGPRLHNPDGSLQPSVRRFPTLLVLIAFLLKLARVLPRVPFGKKYLAFDFNYAQEAAVDQVMGAAFLIRNTVWQKVGPLDEIFWVWFEEVDYCKRVQAAGWQVRYVPSATIVHHGAVSFKQLTSLGRAISFLQSALYYARKHLSLASYLLLLFLYPVAALLSIFAALFSLIKHSQPKTDG